MNNEMEKNERYFAFLSFLCFFGWLLLGSVCFIIPLYVIGPKVSGLPLIDYLSNMELVTEHTYVPAAIASLMGIIVFAVLYRKTIIEDSKYVKNNWLKVLIVIVVGFIVLLAANYVMAIIYEALGFGEDDTSQNQQGIIDALSGYTKHYVMFYTIILAPIFEEIIFRKLFYNFLKKTFKLPVWLIVIILSIVFAAIHVTDVESFVYFPQYFVLSLIITLSYAITKENIFASFGLHFLNNLLAMLEILL